MRVFSLKTLCVCLCVCFQTKEQMKKKKKELRTAELVLQWRRTAELVSHEIKNILYLNGNSNKLIVIRLCLLCFVWNTLLC